MLDTTLQIIGTEWIWIAFLAIILLFGSKKLPELSRALGRAMGEFQRGREEIEREIRRATALSTTPSAGNLPPTVRQKSRLERAAEELGIDTKGKSEEELKTEIRRFMDELRKEGGSRGQSINTEQKRAGKE